MVSKLLIITFFGVGAVAAADLLGPKVSSGIGDKASADLQVLSQADMYRTAGQKAVAASSNTLQNPLERINSAEFGVISERTLFSPSRRAAVVQPVEVAAVQEVPEVAPPPPAPDPGDFTLLGVVVANQDRIALLRWNRTEQILRLRRGDNYSGWKIVEIDERNVLIEQGGAQFSLKLFVGGSGGNAEVAQD